MHFWKKKCFFRHVEAEEKQSKKVKERWCEKDSVAILNESTQLGCVSQDSCPRKILRETGKLGSKHAFKFSKGTWHQIETRERKGPSRGMTQKCAPQERSLCAPKFGERSHEETFPPRRMRPQSSMGFGEHYLQAQEFAQSYVLYSF